MITPDNREQLIDNAIFMLESTDKVRALSDRELSNQVIDKIWSKLNWCSEEDWLLDEFIERFDKAKGIVR